MGYIQKHWSYQTRCLPGTNAPIEQIFSVTSNSSRQKQNGTGSSKYIARYKTSVTKPLH